MTLAPFNRQPLVLLATAALSACAPAADAPTSTWTPPEPVSIVSNQDVWTMTGSSIAWGVSKDSSTAGVLLLRDGDLTGGDDVMFVYRASDGRALTLHFTDWSVELAGAIVGIALKEKAGPRWLASASDQQLAALRYVGVDSVPPGIVPSLQRVAAVNPHVVLGLETTQAVAVALPLFKPAGLFLGDDVTLPKGSLVGQSHLRTVGMQAKQPMAFASLAEASALERLIVLDWKVARSGPLPAGLDSLRTLTIIGVEGLTNVTPFAAAPSSLEELTIIPDDSLSGLAGLARWPGLRALNLQGDVRGGLLVVDSLPALQWLGLPATTTPAQLQSVVDRHPDLAILDLSGATGITDLRPITRLARLTSVVLGDSTTNVAPLGEIRSLRFVGIQRKAFAKSADQVVALKLALPDALIVPVKPFCLGSGWILLLIPPMVVGAVIARRRRAMAHAHA